MARAALCGARVARGVRGTCGMARAVWRGTCGVRATRCACRVPASYWAVSPLAEEEAPASGEPLPVAASPEAPDSGDSEEEADGEPEADSLALALGVSLGPQPLK
ncbi:hypothetical protein GTY77_24065 [Streptomyces sp. SID8380]|nr:hypothetical protein [Streptomyces sp. SID8380]